jgi:hypothetical protein
MLTKLNMPEEHHLQSLEDIQSNATAVFKNISRSNIVFQHPVALMYHSIHSLPSYKSDMHLISRNIHTNGTYSNSNNTNTTPMFTGLNKTTQNHRRRQRKIVQERIQSYVLKQMYFSVNNKKQ